MIANAQRSYRRSQGRSASRQFRSQCSSVLPKNGSKYRRWSPASSDTRLCPLWNAPWPKTPSPQRRKRSEPNGAKTSAITRVQSRGKGDSGRMSTKTPFFQAFGPLLFTRPASGTLRKLGKLDSLRELYELFGHLLPEGLLARSDRGVNSRDRLFGTQVTFWAFAAQILSPGTACRERPFFDFADWAVKGENAVHDRKEMRSSLRPGVQRECSRLGSFRPKYYGGGARSGSISVVHWQVGDRRQLWPDAGRTADTRPRES